MLVWNILLAVIWASLRGNFTTENLIMGYIIGYLLLALLARQGIIESQAYVRRIPKIISLILFFHWELILANLRLAWDAITPGYQMTPGIIAIPLDVKTDAEITLLSNLITLTPGTLSLDVSEDKSVLYIHAMFIDDGDVERVVRSIKNGFERRVMEILR